MGFIDSGENMSDSIFSVGPVFLIALRVLFLLERVLLGVENRLSFPLILLPSGLNYSKPRSSS